VVADPDAHSFGRKTGGRVGVRPRFPCRLCLYATKHACRTDSAPFAMSSLWTPGGERPVGDRSRQEEPRPAPSPPGPAPSRPGEEEPERELTDAELAEVQRQIAEAPAWAVISNHVVGFFQLAGIHLNQQPPKLDEAQLAIDAMAAVVENLAGRLGPDEPTLRDALAQLRLAFVQVRAGAEGTPPPESGTSTPTP
jgi:hypothetical protein